MVQMESAVSGHTFNKIRERLVDKLEILRFDPYSKSYIQFVLNFVLIIIVVVIAY